MLDVVFTRRLASCQQHCGVSVTILRLMTDFTGDVELGRRIRDARERAGLTQEELAARLPFDPPRSQRWISQIETGRRGIDIGPLQDIARALRMPLAELLGEGPPPRPTYRETIARYLHDLPPEVPVVTLSQLISAGPGAAIEAEHVFVESTTIGERRAVAFYAEGNSMEPDIRPGDLCLVDLDLEPQPGDIVVAAVGDPPHEVALVKRFRGETLEGSDGSSYPTSSARLVGVVFEVRHKLR